MTTSVEKSGKSLNTVMLTWKMQMFVTPVITPALLLFLHIMRLNILEYYFNNELLHRVL